MAKVFISFRYQSDGVRKNDVASIIANPEISQRHVPVTVAADVAKLSPPNLDAAIRDAIKMTMEG